MQIVARRSASLNVLLVVGWAKSKGEGMGKNMCGQKKGNQLLAEMREHPGGSEYHVAMFATVPTRGLAPLRLTLKPNSRRLKPVLRTNSHPRARATTANKDRAAGDSGSTMRRYG
jgi:hypothetical protein